MTALTIRLPNSVHLKIKELAERDNISVNQFIASAASEKMASFLTLDYLKAEAAKGNRSDFENFLNLVPNGPVQLGGLSWGGVACWLQSCFWKFTHAPTRQSAHLRRRVVGASVLPGPAQGHLAFHPVFPQYRTQPAPGFCRTKTGYQGPLNTATLLCVPGRGNWLTGSPSDPVVNA